MPAHRRTVPFVRLVLILLLALGLAAVLAAVRPAGAGAASGRLVWSYTRDTVAHNDESIRFSVPGSHGAMYVAGYVGQSSGSTADLAMYEFRQTLTGAGPVVWTRIWDNPSENRSDYPEAMTKDAGGNPIVAGESWTAADTSDWLVMKRSRTGAYKWAITSDGQHGGLNDWVDGAACDRAGNVYVCGTFETGVDQSDLVVAKYRGSDGRRLWVYQYPGSAVPQLSNEAMAIAVDAAGDSYVTGSVDGTSGASNVVVLKLSPGGSEQWMRTISDPSHSRDLGTEIALHNGTLYVAGQIAGVSSTPDFMLARYKTSGSRRWLRSWSPSAFSKGAWINAMTLDGHGDPVVVGDMFLGSNEYKSIAASWRPNGSMRWSRSFWIGTPGLQYSSLYSVVTDANGNVWAAGEAKRVAAYTDAVLLRLRPNGTIRWSRFYDGDAHVDDWFNTISLWGKSSIFAGGATITAAGDFDALAVRFAR